MADLLKLHRSTIPNHCNTERQTKKKKEKKSRFVPSHSVMNLSTSFCNINTAYKASISLSLRGGKWLKWTKATGLPWFLYCRYTVKEKKMIICTHEKGEFVKKKKKKNIVKQSVECLEETYWLDWSFKQQAVPCAAIFTHMVRLPWFGSGYMFKINIVFFFKGADDKTLHILLVLKSSNDIVLQDLKLNTKKRKRNLHVMVALGIIPYIYHSKRPKPSGTFRIEISHQFMYP